MSEQVEKLKLKGYDWLSDEQINHINEFKDLEKQLNHGIKEYEQIN